MRHEIFMLKYSFLVQIAKALLLECRTQKVIYPPFPLIPSIVSAGSLVVFAPKLITVGHKIGVTLWRNTNLHWHDFSQFNEV